MQDKRVKEVIFKSVSRFISMGTIDEMMGKSEGDGQKTGKVRERNRWKRRAKGGK